MKTETHPSPNERAQTQASLAENVREWEETCKNCHPPTPIVCMTNCRIWNSKNELRRLHKIISNPNFTPALLNTLKNTRRLYNLRLISKGYNSIGNLQQELRKIGHNHSLQTIQDEYVTPLLKVGLIEERDNRYYMTSFGRQLLDVIKNCDFEEVLPPHSECHEEKVLHLLLDAPKTFDDFKTVIPTKSIARVLSRLRKAGLIEATKEKDYVFYFKTKREPEKTRFSLTERKIYENIAENGISAQKLAEKAMISLRRTYKYLRKLKGKKMVFSRKKPKIYSLTAKGVQIASALEKIHKLTEETLVATSHFVNDKETSYLPTPDTSYISKAEEQRKHAR
ncbi:MAG: winged helix-turn-helix domain-containing protein [Candidatus Bathyarchaeota archaeon]|jgi:predicted transcriptional regulator|nr:hypothetical protein [Candidatus Bathyarchaeota archaeon A05DMB-5]MDH7557680.1 winged helix-turn-helix domain-containing protein [Candidatus Bathyarchaeota archaeon]